MKKYKIPKAEEIHQNLKKHFVSPLSNPPKTLVWKQFFRVGLPVFSVLLFIIGLISHTWILDRQTPSVQKGVLDLTGWNREKAIEIAGQWEFYWDKLLSDEQIKSGGYAFVLVDVPNKWNSYRIDGADLPGKGRATYHVRVTGVTAGAQYGALIRSMATAYRLYIDGALVAQNGSFGDNERAPSSDYRSQFAAFTSLGNSFDVVMQMSNDVYGMGGMWEPVIFGTYSQVSAYDRLLSASVTSVMAGLVVSCLFFLIFFAAQRGEKDMLILSLLSVLILLRLSVIGDAFFSMLFPKASISLLIELDFLTMPWAQFLLLYFIYCAYGRLVPRWQVAVLFAYTVAVSLFILLLPLDTATSAYTFMNYVLLLVMVSVTVQILRAAWQGREGASLLFFAVLLIIVLIFYDMFIQDRSIEYYLLTKSGFEYMTFIFAQTAVVALRYRRAQKLEIAHLKGQIHPHFIHNALTSIISISRTDPDRSRELLVDFSSYLRGFYDYEQDELVSFSQELELVRAYVALEQARFGKKLRMEYRIETGDFLLPPLMLQPLVENAFVHGLRDKDNGGTVTVCAERTKIGRVRVSVRDDGMGFSHMSVTTRRGVGIENINRRLARLYRTSLVYLVPEDGGCEVCFEIPYMEALKHESMAD